MVNYTNVTTFVFEGVETDYNGNENTIRRNVNTCFDDTWPDIFREFIFSLRGAGYHPDRDGFEDILDEMFGTVHEETEA